MRTLRSALAATVFGLLTSSCGGSTATQVVDAGADAAGDAAPERSDAAVDHARAHPCGERREQALPADAAPQPVAAGEEVYFTHDMVYRASDIRWASR